MNGGTNKQTVLQSQSFNNTCSEMKGYIFDEMTCFFDGGGRNILRGGKRGRGEGSGGKGGGKRGKREGSGGWGPPCPPPHLRRATICLF